MKSNGPLVPLKLSKSTRAHGDGREATRVFPDELDYELDLHEPKWPTVPPRWDRDRKRAPRYLHRRIRLPTKRLLFEAMTKLPSAPLYGIQRWQYHQWDLRRVNLHTLRVLRRPWKGERAPKAERIYLIHNGLNETDKVGFYYELIDHLIGDDPTTVCLLRSIPGHLNRFPHVGPFTEKPLDRYLSDPSDLFRQYLRFMAESKWLLSALAPRAEYPVISGLDLLAPNPQADRSRLNPAVLARAIHGEWLGMYLASQTGSSSAGPELDPHELERQIKTIRDLVRWEPVRNNEPEPEVPDRPGIHVVGYSLGGFLAQSLFFTWPFAVSSCTTLCSGGALREVAPTAFAYPQEWESVVSALPYELDDASIHSSRLRVRTEPRTSIKHVAGLRLRDFSHYMRVFYEVFLQDNDSAYRSRVSDHVARLLFVVGGSDPIVQPERVLEASPEEGFNLIEIANLSHFLFQNEAEWREFWLPEVCSLIKRFGQRCELTTARELALNRFDSTWTGLVVKRGPSEGPADFPQDKPLASEEFEFELNRISKMLESAGYVFVSRNLLPTALFGNDMMKLRGAALHHADRAIANRFLRLQDIGDRLYRYRHNVTVTLPTDFNRWFRALTFQLSPRTDEPGSRSLQDDEVWEIVHKALARWANCGGALREFRPQVPEAWAWNFQEKRIQKSVLNIHTPSNPNSRIVNTLPDVWIGVRSNVFGEEQVEIPPEFARKDRLQRDEFEAKFLYWVANLIEMAEKKRFVALSELLSAESLRIVRVSPARSNPAFRGVRVRNPKTAFDVLVHSALCHGRSREYLVTAKRPPGVSSAKARTTKGSRATPVRSSGSLTQPAPKTRT